MENIKKFTRSTNFTPKEENILLSLVKKYKDSIECKKTDTNTNRIKANAWVELAKEYNSICADFHRDVKTLKNKYENIKKRTKQKFADHKKYIKGTGGGPEKDIIITTTDNDMYDIIETQLTGLSSEFDDDTVAETIHVSTSDSIQIEVTNVDTDCDMPTTSDDTNNIPKKAFSTPGHMKEIEENWAKYTPAMLKTPTTTSLRVPKCKENEVPRRGAGKYSLGYRLEEWATSKVAFADLQQQYFLEEHNLKVSQMKERHQQQLRLQEREAEEKREHLKIEHEARMQLIELEKKNLLKKI